MTQHSGDLFAAAPRELPNSKDAISAFIKSVRLRYTDDAVLWLAFLWRLPEERSRIQRRVLFESGEDNLAVEVMERVGDWYSSPRKRSLDAAVTEVMRICATANWWGQPEGRKYIYAFRRAEIDAPNVKGLGLDDLLEVMRSAIERKNLTRGLAAFNEVYKQREFRPRILANQLLAWSEKYGGQQARRLAQLFDRHASALWLDGNISGQAYYALIQGGFGEQACREVSVEAVEMALGQASENLKNGIAVPTYARDGIHTRGGSDKRFAGTVSYMSGSCRAFEHYGRLSPNDVWLAEFMDMPDGEG